MKLIFVIQGGLGNQLFQLSYYEKLRQNTLYHETDLIFASSIDKLHTRRSFELEGLFSRFPNTKRYNLGTVKYLLLKLFLKCYALLTGESDIDLTFLNTQIVSGYWQTNDHITDELIALLRSHFNISKKAFGTQSLVAVHLRRGDYLRYPYKNIYAIPPVEFYNKSLEYISVRWTPVISKVKIFSDDIGSVENGLLKILNYTTDSVGSDILTDFRNLSEAKFVICSNSTFCWWARRISHHQHYSIFPEPWYVPPRKLSSTLKFGVWLE